MTTPIGPGTRVTPSVRLLRLLGAGGMGSVWAASHEGLGAEVAVKLIRPEQLSHSRSTERFAREASLAARIRSPHVVKVFDHGTTDDGTPYIVMELLRGESLADRIGRERRLEPRLVGLLVTQAAAALEAAHALGVVHRDVKPGNLFLEEAGYELFVKILDFGIAKDTDRLGDESLTETGGIIGTPFYMSPEQLLSPKEIDARADLWGLAVVAYHALTGRLPFSGATVAALAVAMREGPPPPPSSLVSSLPEELDVWFRVALHRDLRLRFADAPALADSFDRAVRGLPSVPAASTEPMERVPAPLPRRSAEGAERPPPTPPTVQSPARDGRVDEEVPFEQASEDRSSRAVEAWVEDADADVSTRSCRIGADEACPPDAPGTAHSGGLAAQPSLAPDVTLRAESGRERAREERDRAGESVPAVAALPLRRGVRAGTLLGAAALVALGYLGMRALTADSPQSGPSPSAAGDLPGEPPAVAGPRASAPLGLEDASATDAVSRGRLAPEVDSASPGPAAPSPPPTSGRAVTSRAGAARPQPSQAPPTASASSTAPDCSQPFVVDEHGDLHPRRECLR